MKSTKKCERAVKTHEIDMIFLENYESLALVAICHRLKAPKRSCQCIFVQARSRVTIPTVSQLLVISCMFRHSDELEESVKSWSVEAMQQSQCIVMWFVKVNLNLCRTVDRTIAVDESLV